MSKLHPDRFKRKRLRKRDDAMYQLGFRDGVLVFGLTVLSIWFTFQFINSFPYHHAQTSAPSQARHGRP